jgi:hypothetical protein
MNRIAAMAAVLGLFVVGILVGALGYHLWLGPHPFAGGALGPRGPMGHPGSFAEHLERRLGLSPEQKEQIEAILAESHAEAEALREELLPQVRAHMERTHDRILEVLTSEQREEFETLRSRHRGSAERFFLGHPKRRPPRRGRGGQEP